MTGTSRFGIDAETETEVATTYTSDTNLSDADFPSEFVILDGDDNTVAITNWTPTVGKLYIIYASNVDNAVTVQLSSGWTWDGTNPRATLDAVGECIFAFAAATNYLKVVGNPDSIAFDTPA